MFFRRAAYSICATSFHMHMLLSVANIFLFVLNIFYFVILLRVLLSWVPMEHNKASGIRYFLEECTDPLLNPIRKGLRFHHGLDFSPLILIILLQIAELALRALLPSLASLS